MKKIMLSAVVFTAALTSVGCAFVKNKPEQTEESWETAYKEVILNVEKHLSDPWGFREDEMPSDSKYIYLVLHDFDKDEIPEMVIGDSGTAAVYRYQNGYAKRITDLCEPEHWGGINGMFLKENMVGIECDGSDGSCFVCFTYDDSRDWGRYVVGTFDDYMPEVAVMNGSVMDAEFFKKQFPLDREDLIENHLIEIIKKRRSDFPGKRWERSADRRFRSQSRHAVRTKHSHASIRFAGNNGCVF